MLFTDSPSATWSSLLPFVIYPMHPFTQVRHHLISYRKRKRLMVTFVLCRIRSAKDVLETHLLRVLRYPLAHRPCTITRR